jgi:glycosyltransferase involved in cell wall biosynthesis
VTSVVRDALIRHASIVAVPSRYEGFGLPALEAMAAGVPVVISDIPALVEVAPRAPRVGVDDVAGWSDALAMLAGDGARRAELSVAGQAAAAEFTPHRTATAMVDVWRRAAATLPS